MFSKEKNNHSSFNVVDTTAPFDFFKDNGYYTVGDKIFNHRIYALQEATRSRTDVKWHFLENELSDINWQARPTTNISELYRIRAQQLRDKYDYLIVAWSGGADSTTIIDSFINNNILLDEIVIAWPVSQTRGKYSANKSLDASNFNSEWDYSIQPKLDYLKINHPNIKITVCDYMKEIKGIEDLEDTVDITAKHSYVSIQKFREVDKIITKRIEQYKNAACLVGIAPVDPVLLDGQYFGIIFTDNFMNPTPKSDYTSKGIPRKIEYFYSTPYLPEIIIEQANLLYNYFNENVHHRQVLQNLSMNKNKTFELTTAGDNEIVRHIRRGILYPSWDNTTFQVAKPKMQTSFNEWYSWFYSNPHSKEYTDPWLSSLRSHENLIDDKYLIYQNNQVINYASHTSKIYIINKFTKEIQ